MGKRRAQPREIVTPSAGELPIPCAECELPAARVVGDTIILTVRHHGERHRTVIKIDGGKLRVEGVE